MTPGPARLGIIVNTGSYERVAFVLQLATAAAAAGQEVALLFGYGALPRLRRGSADVIGEETAAWLRERVRSSVERGTLPRISELLITVLKLGGEILACPSAMALHGASREELIEGVTQVCSLGDFLERHGGAGATILYV